MFYLKFSSWLDNLLDRETNFKQISPDKIAWGLYTHLQKKTSEIVKLISSFPWNSIQNSRRSNFVAKNANCSNYRANSFKSKWWHGGHVLVTLDIICPVNWSIICLRVHALMNTLWHFSSSKLLSNWLNNKLVKGDTS